VGSIYKNHRRIQMKNSYMMKVAFKNAVLKCVNDLRDTFDFPKVDLSIVDVQILEFNSGYNYFDAILTIPKLDESIPELVNIYGYQFNCTFVPKLIGSATENTILIDVLTVQTREYQVMEDDIDFSVHLEEYTYD
jgi:hypothetical protein